MKKYLSLLMIIIASCSSTTRNVKFSNYNNILGKTVTYHILIPNEFEIKRIAGGSEWEEIQFIAKDGALVYINNEPGIPSINYNNIKNKANFENLQSTLSGIDSIGNSWKNVNVENVNYGYVNVPLNKVSEIEKILQSIK